MIFLQKKKSTKRSTKTFNSCCLFNRFNGLEYPREHKVYSTLSLHICKLLTLKCIPIPLEWAVRSLCLDVCVHALMYVKEYGWVGVSVYADGCGWDYIIYAPQFKEHLLLSVDNIQATTLGLQQMVWRNGMCKTLCVYVFIYLHIIFFILLYWKKSLYIKM